MKKICNTLLIVGLGQSGIAYADVQETGLIERIVASSGAIATVSIYLDGPDATSECVGGYRWTLPKTDELFQEKYAALLAAANARQQVTLFHLSGSGCGNWDSNQIYYVLTDYD